jgi:PAS domain S-box-containing protein
VLSWRLAALRLRIAHNGGGTVGLSGDLFEHLAEPFTGESLFDELPELVYFLKDRAGRYAVVNRTLIERCGLRDKRDLIGRRPDEVFPHPFGESYRAQDEAVLRTGEPMLDQLELHLYPSGRVGWCLTNKVPLPGRDGRPAGLAGVSRDLQAQGAGNDDLDRVAEAVRHAQANVHEAPHVDDLARRAGISVFQLDRRLRRLLGLTAGQLLVQLRMDAAQRRLRETDEPIARIALECGYADQSAFTRQFKRATGASPAQFRRAWRRIVGRADGGVEGG